MDQQRREADDPVHRQALGTVVTLAYLRWRWSATPRDLLCGLYFGYPACCALRYAIGTGDQGLQRGVRVTGNRYHVPCGWLHRPDLVFPPDGDTRLDRMIRAR